MIEENQFDTIYHEHFSYFSLSTVAPLILFAKHGLTVFDVEELRTHGGVAPRSLRASRRGLHPAGGPPLSPRFWNRRRRLGVALRSTTYRTFRGAPVGRETKRRLLEFLIDRRSAAGKSVRRLRGAGERETPSSTTAGSGPIFVDFTVDRNPYKQGKFLPGTHIPIYPSGVVSRRRAPTTFLILPWNLARRDRDQLAYTGVGSGTRSAHTACKSVRARRLGAEPRDEGRRVLRRARGPDRRRDPEIPKPMMRIGNRPVLWHVMRYYAAWGHNDFILCLGYKGDVIQRVLPRLQRGGLRTIRARGTRSRLPLGLNKRDIEEWRITLSRPGSIR